MMRFVLLFVLVMSAVRCGGDNNPTQSSQPENEQLQKPLSYDPIGNRVSDFGMSTPGGEGGRVLRVTSLNESGQGSLRAALELQGPRIVVFEVGGVIDLQQEGLRITEPFITVAGQTAPSPGVTIIRGGISIQTHDVKIQHIRVRPGDAGEAKKSGWEPDGIGTAGGDAFNIVIDHCSVSWAVDENLSASGPRTEGPDATSHQITFSNCIVAEGLNDASHSKGPHSKGSLIHDFCREIAIVGNLYAHNVQRNPYFKAFTTGAIVNNVIYNPGSRAVQLSFSEGEWEDVLVTPQGPRVSVVGNVLIHGRDTRQNLELVATRGDAFMEDNIALDREGAPVPLASAQVRIVDERPVWSSQLSPMPASSVADHVIQNAGARPKDRDEVDKRIIREFQERGGRVIDSQNDVGGYPQVVPTSHTLTVPAQGVTEWLAKLAAEFEN